MPKINQQLDTKVRINIGLNQAALVKIFLIFSVLVTVVTYSAGGNYVKKGAAAKPAPKRDVEIKDTNE